MDESARARAVAVEIVRQLRDRGHIAYLAGGCVRDELLGLHPEDYDVATDARPEQVRAIFRRTNEVGAAFGVMLVRLRDVTVEVATFREEGAYSDKRRPDEVRYADAERDARRRDFTINALFLDPLAPKRDWTPARVRRPGAAGVDERTAQGRIHDHVGGLADLGAGLIRAVGDPDLRLAEDHLRALRAVRFSARLSFDLDGNTAEAVRRHAAELMGVSRERIGQEMRRMLTHPTRVASVALLEALALDGPVLDDRRPPGAGGNRPPATLAGAGPAIDAAGPHGFSVALAAWALDRIPAEAPAPTDAIERATPAIVPRLRAALCLTNDERDLLRDLLRGVVTIEARWAGLAVAGQKRAASAPWFRWALALATARTPDAGRSVAERVEELRSTPGGLAPAPIITGDDLVAMGIDPGPRIGAWLEQVYDAQLEGRVRGKKEALEMVQKLARAAGPAG